MPIRIPYWFMKNYVDVSAISIVAKFLFLTPAARLSPPNQQDRLQKQEASPKSDIHLVLMVMLRL